MTRKAQRIVRMIYAGYSDNQDRTPWAHAPVSEEEWAAGAYTEEEHDLLEAYWQGWESGVKDAFANAQRRRTT